MAFSKSDGTPGAFDENGQPVGNRNDGQSIQGVNSKLGSDSANAPETVPTPESTIEGVNVTHSNAPATDNRVKQMSAVNKNTAIREGLPGGYNSYKGTFTDAAKKVVAYAGIDKVTGGNISKNVGDADSSLAPPHGQQKARVSVPAWQWAWNPKYGNTEGDWVNYIDEGMYRMIFGHPSPWRISEMGEPNLPNPCGNLKQDCLKSDLCHDSGSYCGKDGVERHIYQGQLGPYSGYWYEAGDPMLVGSTTQIIPAHVDEDYYPNNPFGCCNSTGKVQSLDGARTSYSDIIGTYGTANASARGCGTSVTGAVGDARGWKHTLNFAGTGLGGLNTWACMSYGHMGNETGYQGFFWEPNDCGSGTGTGDLVGCYLGTVTNLTKVGSFMVGTPDDPCFCETWGSGYGSYGAWADSNPYQGHFQLDARERLVSRCGFAMTRFDGRHNQEKDTWVQCVWTGTCSGVDGPFVMDTGVGYGYDIGGPHGTSTGGGGPQYPTEQDGMLDYCTPKRYLQRTSPASADAINCFLAAANDCATPFALWPLVNNSRSLDSFDDDQFRCVDENSHVLCEEQFIWTAHPDSTKQAIATLGCCLDTSGAPVSDCNALLNQTTGIDASSIMPAPWDEWGGAAENIGAWVSYTGFVAGKPGWSAARADASGDKNWYIWSRSWSGNPFGGSTGVDCTGGDCAWVYQLAHYDCVTDDSANYYTDSVSVPPKSYVGRNPDIDNLKMKGVDTGTSFSAYVTRCEFQYPAVNSFVDCGECYTGVSLYNTGVLVSYTGASAPNTGRNYRIDSSTKTGNQYSDAGCGYTYDLTYMCSGIAVGPTLTDIPEAAVAPTGETRKCFGAGGGCAGKCIYVWENHFIDNSSPAWMWRLLPQNTCNCVCSEPMVDGRFNNEVREGTCT